MFGLEKGCKNNGCVCVKETVYFQKCVLSKIIVFVKQTKLTEKSNVQTTEVTHV